MNNRNDEFNKKLTQLAETSRFYTLKDMVLALAHDVNNRLFIIQSKAYRFKTDFKKEQLTEEKVLEAVGSIENTIADISQQLRNATDFATLPLSESSTEPNLKQICDRALKYCHHKFTKYHISIEQMDNLTELNTKTFLTLGFQVVLNTLRTTFNLINEAALQEKVVILSGQKRDGKVILHVSFKNTAKGPEVSEFKKEDQLRFEHSAELMQFLGGEVLFHNKEQRQIFEIIFPA